MTQVIKLPAIKIVQGVQFAGGWQFVSSYPSERSPIDLTTWTGEFVIADELDSEPLLTVTPILAATGDITVTLTEAQTAALDPARQVGGRAAAIFQITLRAPSPEFDQVWQGAVSIAGRISE
jgi:hypothetical protein